MGQAYTEFIGDILKNAEKGEPIYSEDLARAVEKKYGISKREAAANTAVSLKRIMDRNTIPDLRNYQKGIYYRTVATPFGEIGINKDRLIKDRYMKSDSGYYGGYSLMYQMGLTTQMPAHWTVVTNKAGKYSRKDNRLEIILTPPHTEITAENKEYLKVLDILDLMQKAPVDVKAPYKIVLVYIRDNHLEFEKLLAYATLYYNQNTVNQLAKVAVEGGIYSESARG